MNIGNTVPCRPDILPGVFFNIQILAEVDFLVGQIFGIETGVDNAFTQEITVYAGKSIGIDNIFQCAVDDHLLIRLIGVAFFRSNKSGSDIGEISTGCPGSGNMGAAGQAAGQRNIAIEKATDFGQ